MKQLRQLENLKQNAYLLLMLSPTLLALQHIIRSTIKINVTIQEWIIIVSHFLFNNFLVTKPVESKSLSELLVKLRLL